tara:strand:- start:452 stop:682 length:231 start_codon:yes stop_codon:yes gene_type:complete
MNTYDKSEIRNMNSTYPWSGSIKTTEKTNNKTTTEKESKYILLATGDVDITNGRIYVALPAKITLTPEVKKIYNIM